MREVTADGAAGLADGGHRPLALHGLPAGSLLAGIVGAFLGAVIGAVVVGAIVLIIDGQTLGKRRRHALSAIPGVVIGLAIVWMIGSREPHYD